jgi:flagellar P-ring protein precursor FlgI
MTRASLNVLLLLLFAIAESHAARLKDIVNVRGVRENQLVGYGLVVGLNGTGDSPLEFTNKSMRRLLGQLGVAVEGKDVAGKNVAAVIITATLPPFAKAGNKIDITVNSIGDATSLSGGTLLQAPLRAGDQQVYAVAQGSLLVGGGLKQAHLTVGRIPNGAMIERDVSDEFASRKMFRLTLQSPDFTTAARIARKINVDLGGKYASAKDSSTIDVVVPFSYEGKAVELLATIENLDVEPDLKAKVIVNEKTGTVIIGEGVRVSKIAISHGDLVLQVEGKNPNDSKKDEQKERLGVIEATVSIGDLVRAMNRLGVNPKDLITILQNLKAAGALQGELEIL